MLRYPTGESKTGDRLRLEKFIEAENLTRNQWTDNEGQTLDGMQVWFTDGNNRRLWNRSVQKGQKQWKPFPLREPATAFQLEVFAILQMATRGKVKNGFEKEIRIHSNSQL